MLATSPPLPIHVLGWIGNACFFSRFFVQWFLSERAKKSIAPPVFWWLSLAGTVTLGTYASWRETYVLVLGYLVNGLIYTRNLWVQRGSARPLARGQASSLGLVAIALLVGAAMFELRQRQESELAWIVVAGIGQSLWSSRFVVQWWASERAEESHFPRLFWWLSLAGNALLLAFTIHLRDAVLIAGYAPGPLVQIRNLMLGRAQHAPRGSIE